MNSRKQRFTVTAKTEKLIRGESWEGRARMESLETKHSRGKQNPLSTCSKREEKTQRRETKGRLSGTKL